MPWRKIGNIRDLRRVDLAETWKHAKSQFATMVAERDAWKSECYALVRENEALKGQLDEARANILARYECWTELVRLHREHTIARAKVAERQPGELLH